MHLLVFLLIGNLQVLITSEVINLCDMSIWVACVDFFSVHGSRAGLRAGFPFVRVIRSDVCLLSRIVKCSSQHWQWR